MERYCYWSCHPRWRLVQYRRQLRVVEAALERSVEHAHQPWLSSRSFQVGKKMCIFELYKIAIEGRNSHYKNYNEWVNLYSIFTGAIFVGFYTTYDKDNFLSVFLCLLGIIVSMCWIVSVKGYYNWILSWIKIVHEYEKELNSNAVCLNCSDCKYKCNEDANIDKKKYYVYSVYMGDRNKKEHYSTQKDTLFLTYCIMIAWDIIFLYLTFKLIKNSVGFDIGIVLLLTVFIAFVLLFLELFFLRVVIKRRFLSNISSMKGEISEY